MGSYETKLIFADSDCPRRHQMPDHYEIQYLYSSTLCSGYKEDESHSRDRTSTIGDVHDRWGRCERFDHVV